MRILQSVTGISRLINHYRSQTSNFIIMHQFLIEDVNRDEVIKWCSHTMVQQYDYQWFPFFRSDTGKNAFSIYIFNEEDASAFILSWGHIVLGTRLL